MNAQTAGLKDFFQLNSQLKSKYSGRAKKNPLNCMINSLFIYDIYRWRVKIESECQMNVRQVLVGVSKASNEDASHKRERKAALHASSVRGRTPPLVPY